MTEIEELKLIIAQGEEFRKQGYDVDVFQQINIALLKELEAVAHDT